MSSPDIGERERTAVQMVLNTNTLSIGPQIEAFEGEMARFVGSRHAVGVSSGTGGLHLAVIGAGVEEGDLVLTTPFSFIASANCILYERGIPVFLDVDRRTGNIDPVLVQEALEAFFSAKTGKSVVGILPPAVPHRKGRKPKLKALLPVDAFGQPADMDPIVLAARPYNLPVIEDACEALGAEYKGRKAGTLGDVGTFAFYPNKQITTGEGGILVTDDLDKAGLYRSLRNQGRDEFNAWLNHTRLGYNYRLDEMSAALGSAQLKRIDELLLKRDRVAGMYNERLRGFEFIHVPYVAPTTTRMSWFVYVVRLDPRFDRDVVMRRLAERGIPSRPYFLPIHLQPFYVKKFGYRPGLFPVAEQLGRVSLALPFSGVMTADQVDYVCENIMKILRAD
jgi:dTDP-4-amino-4,6-dideoxygalactose transaminase